jgi:ABC-type sugar transport system permease subunit
VMTGGGPFFASDVVSTYVFRTAFSAEQGAVRMGYATAAGVFFGITSLLIVGLQALVVRAAGNRRPRVRRSVGA